MKLFQRTSRSSGAVAMVLASLIGCAEDAPPPARADEVSALTCPEPQPIELTPEDPSALAPSIATFNVGARNGFTWCRLDEASLYSTPACPEAPVTLADIIDQLGASDEMLRGYSFADGQVLTAAEVAAIEPFGTVCSPGGPGVASAVDANVSGSTPEGWVVDSEIPCHNCHEFAHVYVLWYPADRMVLVLPYVTGFDS
jgi:hypothetical protein